jgi:hypothetical protein
MTSAERTRVDSKHFDAISQRLALIGDRRRELEALGSAVAALLLGPDNLDPATRVRR